MGNRPTQNLQELELFDNRLTGIPLEIGQLTNLRYIDISDNRHNIPLEGGDTDDTLALLDYLRNQAAMQAQQIALAIAGMVGLVAAFLLAFRWKTRQSGRKKKRAA